MLNSPFGIVLLASRQNNRRTASLGYPVSALQFFAFTIAGAISGVAGALFGMLYRIMPIGSIHWEASAYVAFMVIIDGTRSMLGPVIGAAIFIWLQGLFSQVWTRWPLLLDCRVPGSRRQSLRVLAAGHAFLKRCGMGVRLSGSARTERDRRCAGAGVETESCLRCNDPLA